MGIGLGRAALVAHQPLEEAVLDHARVAIVAADLVPAGPAQRHRRIAAAVDEQHRLLAALQPLGHRGAQSPEIQRSAGSFSPRMSTTPMRGITAAP